VLACRSLQRSREIMDEINSISADTPTLWLPLELASQSGLYYAECAVAEPEAFATDADKAVRLWHWTEDVLAQRGCHIRGA
jgi:hypothetical protein